MNEKTKRQIERMKQQSFGVEIECNKITRRAASRLAAEYFGTGRTADTSGRNGYECQSAWDSEGREWRFQKDASIHGPDCEKCEVIKILNRNKI